MTEQILLNRIKSIIPALNSTLYKGASGRVAVVGGCKLYTGAPYYAAISSLKIGMDLSYVFCTPEASIPIKSYSPELMVIPALSKDVSELTTGLDRIKSLHSMIFGPGLGRDDSTFEATKIILKEALRQDVPVVLDGDALFLVANDDEALQMVIEATSLVYLTPNRMEFKRLADKLKIPISETRLKPLNKGLFLFDAAAESIDSPVVQMSKMLGNKIVVLKGAADQISDGTSFASNDKYGSSRRCGGQGDVLAGSVGSFTAWFVGSKETNPILPALAASLLVRKANEISFQQKKRSMTTPDIIENIGSVFYDLFESEASDINSGL
eukprot:maker-scaffold_44-snap-gene-0.49-mRNA-1 protein AED:0.01 eAED:0.01 QI:164/1/1/1/0/0/2/95/324